MKKTCRNRRNRIRLDRVFGVTAIFGVFILILALNGIWVSRMADGKKTTESVVSTDKENTTDVNEETPKIKHLDNVTDLYISDEISKSEKNSMFRFYSSEYSAEFESYYSKRLGRYVTSFEMYHLTRICYSEAGTQGITGKTAVVATILNRMEDTTGLFENRIYDVIFQEYQFSSADILDDARETAGKYFSGGIELEYASLDDGIKADCLTAVKRALDGEDPTREITGGALFFYNPDQCSDEELALRANIPYDKIFIEEDHWFHREWPTA